MGSGFWKQFQCFITTAKLLFTEHAQKLFLEKRKVYEKFT